MDVQSIVGAALCATMLAGSAWGQDVPVPSLTQENGRHVLLVDGRPFIILGGQVTNSSNYVVALPRVWQVARDLNANTMEVPVAWEQIEPREGQFDFSYVDQLLREAREQKLRLVLLWFGTWKGGAGHYTPEWVKTDQRRFPRQIGQSGKPVSSFSPFGRATIEADKAAYTHLLRHLRDTDRQRTVIMMQVENEPGTLDGPRDFSPAARAAFEQPVADDLARALGKQPGSWAALFGQAADRSFAAWSLSRAVGEIAAAGKAVYPLPTMVNAPGTNSPLPGGRSFMLPFASGGPDWQDLAIWKAMAPAIDIEAANIYSTDPEMYAALLDAYAKPNNPTIVPETGVGPASARFFWLALSKGTLGFSPFGVDRPTGSPAPRDAEAMGDPLSASFALFRPIVSDWARLGSKHPVWGGVKVKQDAPLTNTMGRWRVEIAFDPRPRFAPPPSPANAAVPGPPAVPPAMPAAARPIERGGAVVMQSGPDEFYVAGTHANVTIQLADAEAKEAGEYLTIEEGTFENGQWKMVRRWNGDERDHGMDFGAAPALVRVKMHAITSPPP